MSHWNRAYLDALEVPVWVPLNDQTEEKTVRNPDGSSDEKAGQMQAATQENAVSSDTVPAEEIPTAPAEYDYIRFLQGDSSADFVFVIPKNADQASCTASLRQLELAWKAWLEQPFIVAIAQLTEQSEHSQKLETCRGKIIICGDELTSIEHPSIPAPALGSLQAHKKDWWSLLQRLQ